MGVEKDSLTINLSLSVLLLETITKTATTNPKAHLLQWAVVRESQTLTLSLTNHLHSFPIYVLHRLWLASKLVTRTLRIRTNKQNKVEDQTRERERRLIECRWKLFGQNLLDREKEKASLARDLETSWLY